MNEKKKKTKLALGLIIVIAIVGFASLKIGQVLPTIGAIDTPANMNVSQYYIANSAEETHATNIVTAILADYRGFDTLFETCVLLLSCVAVLTVLSPKAKVSSKPDEERLERQKQSSFGSVLMDGSFRIIVPLVLIYSMYVLFHGEISLGGGFQAGALIACAYLLNRIVPKFDKRKQKAREELGVIISCIGVIIYILAGLLPMLNGGNFLEYGMLPFGEAGSADLHAAGILMIEVGVTVAVAGVILTILEVVFERTDFND